VSSPFCKTFFLFLEILAIVNSHFHLHQYRIFPKLLMDSYHIVSLNFISDIVGGVSKPNSKEPYIVTTRVIRFSVAFIFKSQNTRTILKRVIDLGQSLIRPYFC